MEKMKIVKILDLDELGVIEFYPHRVYLDSIQASKFFDNGLGVSIISKCDEIEKENSEKITIEGLFSTSCGRWEDGTFELAVIQGNDDQYEFVQNEFLKYKDEEYFHNDGIWRFKNIDKVKEIISTIKNLEPVTKNINNEDNKNDKIQ